MYEGNGTEDGRYRSGGGEVSDRLYSAVGENSIDFSWILYRLFPDTSVQTLVQHGSNDLIAWEERFVRMGVPLRSHRTTVLVSW